MAKSLQRPLGDVAKILPVNRQKPELYGAGEFLVPHEKETEMDKFKGWRTLAFNLGVAALGVAQATDWTSVLGPSPYTGWVVMAIGVAGMALRSVTSTPVGVK